MSFGTYLAGTFVTGVVATLGHTFLQTPDRPARYIVATDLEPDDMVALLHLRMRGIQPDALIVGEGDAATKTRRARTYVKLLGWDTTRVIRSDGSDKAFPEDGSDLDLPGVKQVADALPNDFSLSSTSWLRKLQNLEQEVNETEDQDQQESGSILGWFSLRRWRRRAPMTFLCLKPPRELLHAEQEDSYKARALFGDMVLALSGPSNLRDVGYASVLKWLNPDSTPFRRVLWYEPGGRGLWHGTQSLNTANMAQIHGGSGPPCLALPDPKSGLGLYCACIRHVASVWDAHALRECEAGRGGKNDPALIRAHLGSQVAATDLVLVALLTADESDYGCCVASATMDEGDLCPKVAYTYADGSKTNVVKFRNKDDEEVKWELADAFRAAFLKN